MPTYSRAFLVREKSYMDYLLPEEESALINDEIVAHGIDLRLGTELKSIIGPDRATAVETNLGERIDCQLCRPDGGRASEH